VKTLVISSFLLCAALGAQDAPQGLSALMERLDDEDFNVREKASGELSDYPEEYVEKFLLMSREQAEHPEVWSRLKRAAKDVFHKTTILKDDYYLRMMGDVGFSQAYFFRWATKDDTWSTVKKFLGMYEPVGFVIRGVNPAGPAAGKLQDGDIVMKVDGRKPWEKYDNPGIWVLAGKPVTLTVRRYAQPKDAISNGIEEGNRDYVQFEVVIVGGWKDEAPDYVNRCEWYVERALDRAKEMWDSYLKEFECSHPPPELPNVYQSRFRRLHR
jgi:hypothetical protein